MFLSSPEDLFNPARITIIRDIAKLLKDSKDLDDAKKKLKNYGLTMLGLEDL
jgi:hypothetical protein